MASIKAVWPSSLAPSGPEPGSESGEGALELSEQVEVAVGRHDVVRHRRLHVRHQGGVQVAAQLEVGGIARGDEGQGAHGAGTPS